MPTHTEAIRSRVQELLRAVPFRPFTLALNNGQEATVGHPENIAFDPDVPEVEEFYVASGKRLIISTFSAVSDIILARDRKGAPG